MPNRLHRYYGAGYLHFITFSCYRRRPLLAGKRNRDPFLKVLEQVRRRYRCVVVGYVVMPEHVHLLIGEPERGDPSLLMQVLKQRTAKGLSRACSDPRQGRLWEDENHVWQRRFYDCVVWSERKRVEKLKYMHRNPVKRGLVVEPQQWIWSSYRHYAFGESAPVLADEQKAAELKPRRAAV